MHRRRAFITGITGQDGSYLAELLLSKGYEVFGLLRRCSRPRLENIADVVNQITLVPGDLTDSTALTKLLADIKPDEIYNLGAQSCVKHSWSSPIATGDITGLSVTRLLEAALAACPRARIYQAGSSEMFGKVREIPQSETTAFYPRSPYAAAKVYAHSIAVNYRESYGMFVANGILFNHESPRRGIEFVTRKITHAVARIKAGHQTTLGLGNLAASRDWGYAPEYVLGMWQMLQADQPDDYVLGTGVEHTVREFVELAFELADLDWTEFVVLDKQMLRPAEVNTLRADPTKARTALGWRTEVSFEQLVELMLAADMAAIRCQ